ncbi:MAG: ABC transporter permease [Acidimicrobiales bacterium]|nr:ABC transporter permease [Acidimicrobiales bacterium]MDP6648518.1 ABC transporter permease [Acidimicrobiales bacterium]MDP6759042.1 ABC transporter permease [Acidimicrobiales bacterium]
MRLDSPTGLRLASAQTLALTRRSVVSEWRQLGNVLPGLVFPLLLAAVYTHQFERVILLPGFPAVDSFLDFVLPASLLQSVSFGATEAGTELARDIENGFFDRLRASPCARLPLLMGRLGGAMAVAAAKGVLIVMVFLMFGAEIAGGPAATVVVVAAAVLIVLAIGGLGQVLAILTGNQEAVNATFPLVFTSIFMSSAFFPTTLMSGWFRQVAEANPVTWIIDPVRRLILEGWSWSDVGQALGVPLVLSVITVTMAVVALDRRLGAT